MMRIEWNNLSPISPSGGIAARPRLGAGEIETAAAVPSGSTGLPSAAPEANLTADALRAVLLEIGIAADPEAMQIAEAFTRLGLPLTDSNIGEGRSILARFPKLPAAAYAMARLLDAPLTPGVLRALARVIEGALAKRPLPQDALSDLGLALDGASGDAREIAHQLYQIVSRLGRSTEQQLAASLQTGDDPLETLLTNDPRAQLLALSADSLDRSVRLAADSHAAHIEGQQLLNQIALQRFDPPVPLYFAFPFKLGSGETVPAEVQVWTRDDEDDEDGGRKKYGEFDDARIVLNTTIRLSPPRLGQIEIRLMGRQDANLTCQVLVERPNSYRLLRRSSAELSSGLSKAGWSVGAVNIGMADDFAPLWYGGAALTQPRGRVDQKV